VDKEAICQKRVNFDCFFVCFAERRSVVCADRQIGGRRAAVSGKATTAQAAPVVPKNRVLPKKDHDAFKQLVVRDNEEHMPKSNREGGKGKKKNFF
jgi:hypothetical protein